MTVLSMMARKGGFAAALMLSLALLAGAPVLAAPAAPPAGGVHTPPPAESAAHLARIRVEALAYFDALDARAKPAPGGIVFVGSSTFAMWPDLAGDMAPLPVFNRAISGTTSAQQLDAIDRLALTYRPSIVVFYAGSNDIAYGAPAERVAGNILRYAALLHERLPGAHFVFTSINRAPQRRAKWALSERVNARIRAEADRNPGWFTYADINSVLQDGKGEPLPGIYAADQIHIVPSAYARLTAVIRPVLEKLMRP